MALRSPFPTTAASSSSSTTPTSIDVPAIFIFDTSLSRRRFLEIVGSLPTAPLIANANLNAGPGSGSTSNPNSNPNRPLNRSTSSSSNTPGNGPASRNASGAAVPAGAKGELGEIVKRIMRGRGGTVSPTLPVGTGKGKGKERDGGVAGGRQPRFAIIVTSPTPQPHPSSNPSTFQSFIPPAHNPIVHSQYFLPLDAFWPALPNLAGLFPLEGWSPPPSPSGGGKAGFAGKKGEGRDEPGSGLGSGADLGTGQGVGTGAGTTSRTTPEEDNGLLEGFIAALETFDLQNRNPFGGSGSLDGLSPFAGSEKQTEAERYLFLCSGRDPALFLEERPAWVVTQSNEGMKEETDRTPTVRARSLTAELKLKPKNASSALTGLISPSPSPEDRAQLLSALSPTRRNATTALHQRADRALRRRVRSNWVKDLDDVMWPAMADELQKRDVTVGAVMSGFGGTLRDADGSVPVGTLAPGLDGESSGLRWVGCISGVFDRIQAQSRSGETAGAAGKASPWWSLVHGTRVLLPNWQEKQPDPPPGANARAVSGPADNEKNANGKRPLAAASPLQQDLETEAKRFKAEREAAVAQQQAMAASLSRKLATPSVFQSNMSNLTPGQMALVHNAIAQQAQAEQVAEQNKANAGQAIQPQSTSAVSAGYSEMNAKLYGAHANTIGNVTMPPLPPPVNTAARTPVPIWKGRILTAPPRQGSNGVMQQPDLSTAPMVTAIAVNNGAGSIEDYIPASWPSHFLAVRQACRRDMQALQHCATSRQCVFVEFRPDTTPSPGMQANHHAFMNLANKLVNAEVMLICPFGPTEGGGLILTPHRAKENFPWKLLGACFFKTPMPLHILQNRANPPPPPPQQMPISQSNPLSNGSHPGMPPRMPSMPSQMQGPSRSLPATLAVPQDSLSGGFDASQILRDPAILTAVLKGIGKDPAGMRGLSGQDAQEILARAAAELHANPGKYPRPHG